MSKLDFIKNNLSSYSPLSKNPHKMLVKESLLDLQETFVSKNMQNNIDEEEETLSLCDLPLYGDQSIDDGEGDLSRESEGSSSISSSEDDYFEFFSQELNPKPSSTTSPPDNIVFCGKLIPYKQPDILKEDTFERKHQNNKKKHGNWGLFGWKLSSSKRHASSERSSIPQSPKKKTHENNRSRKGYEFPVHKMSILTSSSSGKARWYFLLFGISSKISTEVDLRDIKNRQSRRLYPSSPTSSPLFRIESNNEKIISRGRNGGWGLWGLIKALSCGGGNHHPNTMVLSQ